MTETGRRTCQAIWCDLATRCSDFWGGNNVQSNRASIQQTLEAVVQPSNKVSLYELLMLHAMMRGELVEHRKDADFVVAYDGDLDPTMTTRIQSEFMA